MKNKTQSGWRGGTHQYDLEVDGNLIQELRVRQGSDIGSIAEAIGVSFRVMAEIEGEGRIFNGLRVRAFTRLASELGVPPEALLRAVAPDTVSPCDLPPSRVAQPQNDDPTTLAGALINSTKAIPKSALEDVTGWPRARLNAAKRTLDKRLRPAGLHVHESMQQLSIVPTDLGMLDLQAKTLAAVRNRRGLEPLEAILLAQALKAGVTGRSGASLVRLRALVNAGYLEYGGSSAATGYWPSRAVQRGSDFVRALPASRKATPLAKDLFPALRPTVIGTPLARATDAQTLP